MGKKNKGDYVNYEKMYGLQYTPQHTHEDDTDLDPKDEQAKSAMISGHMANNYDLRRTHEMMQDDGFRRHMKEEGFKGVDRLVKDNMPGEQWMGQIAKWGRKAGIHNGKDFDTRDLGATFKSFANENQKYGESQMDAKYASQNSLDEMKDKLLNKDKRPETADVTETSPDLSEAQEEVNNYNTNYLTNAGDTITGKSTSEPTTEFDDEVAVNEGNPDADNTMGSNSYKNDYSFDVKKGLKLSGVPTRGPGTPA